MMQAINNRTYQPKRSICFVVSRPKYREVFAADFADRIIHHYIRLRLEPIIEKEFNDRTANQPGMIIPVVITVYKDKSFEFITKVPPVAVLIKKALKIEKGSGKPNKDKVANITKEQVKQIAETKMEDLNAASLEAAMSMVAGTARSMGVVVVD